MVTPDVISNTYERNLAVLKLQLDGLTHEDSLLQLPFRGNCLNYLLGHMAVSRQTVLGWMDQPLVVDADELALYQRDADAITGATDGVLEMSRLVEILDQSQAAIEATLAEMSAEDIAKVVNEKGTQLWQRLEFLAWHEAYHVGQTEYLRQLAGMDDKVI